MPKVPTIKQAIRHSLTLWRRILKLAEAGKWLEAQTCHGEAGKKACKQWGWACPWCAIGECEAPCRVRAICKLRHAELEKKI